MGLHWRPEGDALIAWANDTEFFEIVPVGDGAHDVHRLVFNDLQRQVSVVVGRYFELRMAKAAAEVICLVKEGKSAPRPPQWEINAEHMTSWISDTEVLDISPTGRGTVALHYNNVADGTCQPLGEFARLADAERYACTWLGCDHAEAAQ